MSSRSWIAGLLGTTLLPLTLAGAGQSAPSGVRIESLGHSAFLIQGGGPTLLINPFKPGGCTAGLPLPAKRADLVLTSSKLLDEGYAEAVPGKPQVLDAAGAYRVGSMLMQGISMPHDRLQGRRFGPNTAWKWRQGGLTLIHLGGAAAPLSLEQQILLGQPDVLMIPVGGGPKSYTPAEAKDAIALLKPKVVIPMMYRTKGADPKQCDLQPLQDFLTLMKGTPIRNVGRTLAITPASLPKKGMEITVLQ